MLHVELVSPERILYSGEAEMVVCRTVDGGDIAFLTGHAPFVGELAIWKLFVRTPGGDEEAAVYGGFVEVRENRVTILSDHADWPGLLQAIKETGAERVWVTHGYVAVLVRWLREHGIEAEGLQTRFEGERDETGDEAAEEAGGVAP